MKKNHYVIGIDLGTTNCTLAYADALNKNIIQQFAITQITSPGTIEESPVLPSFIYFPLNEEIQAKMTAIDWNTDGHICVGSFSRDRGKEMPDRLISSAKSWLSHGGIERRKPILPIHTEGDLSKKSPLEACSELLIHLKKSWNHRMDCLLEEQQLLITVPASFDPSARQLVQEAAAQAGYPEPILIEEPQAAFYAWLYRHENDWRKILKAGDRVLVIDVGGGTTDFSMIEVQDLGGELALNRQAVGPHLLLGGDNMDFAFAHLVKQKFEEQGKELDDWQMSSLIHSCRSAKEALLSDSSPKSVDIAIKGRGSKLIGGMLKTKISSEEAVTLIVEGFVPMVTPDERSLAERRGGLQQMGLPYAKDPRISCQLAKFLSMTGDVDSASMENFILPTAVLFNGGTMKAAVLRKRLMEVLNKWASQLNHPSIKELEGADYDYAVSLGAVYYGLARGGKGIRMKSGTSRSYYIGVEDSVPAIPGVPVPMKAICIAPFGMEEGSEQQLESQEFALVVGEFATFKFFSHSTPLLSNGVSPITGTILKNWKQELTELHPIEVLLSKEEGDGKMIQVKISSRVTELGVLEVWCKAEDGRKWKLEFDTRECHQLSGV